MTIRDGRSRQGHSLLEVLVSSSVVVVAVLGLVAALLSGMKTTEQSYQATREQALAQQIFEELAEVPFEDLLGQDGSIVQSGQGLVAEVTVVEVSPDQRSIRIEAYDEKAPERRYEVLTLRARR